MFDNRISGGVKRNSLEEHHEKKFTHCNGYRKDCGRKSLPRIKYFDRDIKTLIKKFLVVRDNRN